MAKLTGPLFSMSATGKLADTLVYASWKGIQYARQKVDPSNPNTPAQQTQRANLTLALSFWQDTTKKLNDLDKSNLTRAAGLFGRAMSGFNAFVKGIIDTKVLGATPVQLYATVEDSPAATSTTVSCKTGVSTASVRLYWGSSKTALNNLVTRTEASTAGSDHTFAITGLVASSNYYYRIEQVSGGSKHNLGVGTFLTAAS